MHKNKHILFQFLKFSFQAYKPYFLVLLVYTVIQSAQTIFGAYTLSLLIRFLEYGEYPRAVMAGLILVVIELVLAFLLKYADRLLDIHQRKMEEAVNHRIAEKILSIPFSYLENPYYLELKRNAQMGVNSMGAVYLLLRCFSKILSSLVSLIGLAAIIVTFDLVLIVVLIAGIVLTSVLVLLSMKSQVKFYKDLLPINFKYNYYLETLINEKNSKEFRLYSIYHLMNKSFHGYGAKTIKNFKRITFKMGMYEALTSAVRHIEMAFVYILVGIKTITQHLPISRFSLTVSSALTFSDCVTAILDASGNYIRSIEYVKPVIELMNIKEEQNDGKRQLTEIETIEFDHVSFAYPNTDKIILNDVSFTFEAKNKISIVGLNGAGKTTIVKLLCRLYEPNSGRILINGVPISEYEHTSYMKQVSAVFQDYRLFAYSIRENIRPGLSSAEAAVLCHKVGIGKRIEELPNAYDSTLSKSYEEDGVELSGGQMQKIAIARALAKPASLLILDEPTSALDPLAEAEIYENFNSLADNKMAIYISHRMSSSIFCDKILVLDGGIVSDFDTHHNLMQKQDSLYYELFMTQAKNYALKEE